MVGHGGSCAGLYLSNPTSPIPSHCASIVSTSTVRVKSLEKFKEIEYFINTVFGLKSLDSVSVMKLIRFHARTALWPDYGTAILYMQQSLMANIKDIQGHAAGYIHISSRLKTSLDYALLIDKMHITVSRLVGWTDSVFSSREFGMTKLGLSQRSLRGD